MVLTKPLTPGLEEIDSLCYNVAKYKIQHFSKRAVTQIMTKPVTVYYSASKKNLGDAANLPVLQELFAVNVQLASPEQADLLAVGSILGKLVVPGWNLPARLSGCFKKPAAVWSSGFIEAPSKTGALRRKVEVFALRGDLSRQAMSRLLGRELQCPLGDGGLLMPELLTKRPEKKFRLGIVPHYKEVDHPQIAALAAKIPGSMVISPIGEVCEVLEKIAACEVIVSSSLHGLIVSDALSIPNMHFIGSSAIRGGVFKYQDYYSAYQLEHEAMLLSDCLKEQDLIDTVRCRYRISSGQVSDMIGKLREAFPFR